LPHHLEAILVQPEAHKLLLLPPLEQEEVWPEPAKGRWLGKQLGIAGGDPVEKLFIFDQNSLF
jgi:hypothetical protein